MTRLAGASSARPTLRSLLVGALLAGVLSSVVNVLLWLALRGDFGTIRVGPPGRQTPFPPSAIVLFSVVGALGAAAVYALIARLSRVPNRVFTWIAVAVLLLSFVTPLSLQNPPISVVLALELMHVVVFAFVLWLVPRR